MPQHTATVRSAWSVDRTFEYMADLRNFEHWDPGVKAVHQSNGAGASADATFVVTVGGVLRDIVLTYETIEYRPPQRVSVRARNGVLESLDEIDVQAVEGGCEVTYQAALNFRGLWRPLNPLLGLVLKRIVERAANGLREVVTQPAL